MILKENDLDELINCLVYQEGMYRIFALAFSGSPTQELVERIASSSLKHADVEICGYSVAFKKTWQGFLYFTSRLYNIQPVDMSVLLKNITNSYENYLASEVIPLCEFAYITRADISNETLREELLQKYCDAGMVNKKSMPADHVSCEMIYMAHMRGTCRYYLENDDKEKFYETLKIQQLFYKEHISVWAQFFCYLTADMDERIPFYRHIGAMMGIFLREDTSFLQRVLEQNALP